MCVEIYHCFSHKQAVALEKHLIRKCLASLARIPAQLEFRRAKNEVRGKNLRSERVRGALPPPPIFC